MVTACCDAYVRTLEYFGLCCECCDPFLKLDDAVSEHHFTKEAYPLAHTINLPICCGLQFCVKSLRLVNFDLMTQLCNLQDRLFLLSLKGRQVMLRP